jgi:hypothetical protein
MLHGVYKGKVYLLYERNAHLQVVTRTCTSSLSCGDLGYTKHVSPEVLRLYPKARESKAKKMKAENFNRLS